MASNPGRVLADPEKLTTNQESGGQDSERSSSSSASSTNALTGMGLIQSPGQPVTPRSRAERVSDLGAYSSDSGMTSNPEYVSTSDRPPLIRYQKNSKFEGPKGESSRRNSASYKSGLTGQGLIHGLGHQVWARSQNYPERIPEEGQHQYDYETMSNLRYTPDNDMSQLTRNQRISSPYGIGSLNGIGSHNGSRSSHSSIIYNNSLTGMPLVQSPGDLIWVKPKSYTGSIPEDGDDPCDSVERDAMDEAERDESDDEAESSYMCCAQTRHNCVRLKEILREEASLVKKSLRKIEFKKKIRSYFTLQRVKSIFPILNWGPKYRTAELQGDIIAGVTVGMTLIPQAIAYARIANLPPEHGLYSSIIGCFIYVVFGTSKDVALGPTAIQSLLTAHYGKGVVQGDATRAILLGFFTGIVQLGMFILGLGALIDLIPFAVMKAFTVACSITIGFTQVKKWLGEKGVPGEFLPQLAGTFRKIPEARLWDFLLGCVCIFFIVVMRKLKEKQWKRKLRELPWHLKIVKKGLWFIGTARNIIVLIIATGIAYVFVEHGENPFSLTGFIPPGIPSFHPPNFTVFDPTKNETLDIHDLASEMSIGIIVLPVLGLIETMSIVKVYARKFNYQADANQELLPFGISNILGSFIQGYAVCASFSRTAVNSGSGVKTPAGGIISGAIVLLALQFLTPMFYYIPEAALAVVIILAVLDPITFHKVWIFWKIRKIDLIPWFVTFILSFVLSIEWGVLIGAGLALLMLLYPVLRPSIRIHEPEYEVNNERMKVIIVTLDSGLVYPAVEYIKRKIFSYCTKVSGAKYVVLDFSHVSVIDTTTVQGVRELLEDFNKRGITVFLCGMQKGVATIFRKAQLRFLNQAATVSDAVNLTQTMQEKSMGSRTMNDSDGPRPAVLQYVWELTQGRHDLHNRTLDETLQRLQQPPSYQPPSALNLGKFSQV